MPWSHTISFTKQKSITAQEQEGDKVMEVRRKLTSAGLRTIDYIWNCNGAFSYVGGQNDLESWKQVTYHGSK